MKNHIAGSDVNCPRRLHTDSRLLKDETPPAWLSRRANMMRERYATPDHQAIATLNLIAPVQPSITHPAIMGIAPNAARS